MKTKKSKVSLDCIAMKREAQAKLVAETQGMTHAEELAFYRRRVAAGSMGSFWRSIGGEAVQGGPDPKSPAQAKAGGARAKPAPGSETARRRAAPRGRRSR